MFSFTSSGTGVPNKVAGDCEVMREALRSPSDVENRALHELNLRLEHVLGGNTGRKFLLPSSFVLDGSDAARGGKSPVGPEPAVSALCLVFLRQRRERDFHSLLDSLMDVKIDVRMLSVRPGDVVLLRGTEEFY